MIYILLFIEDFFLLICCNTFSCFTAEKELVEFLAEEIVAEKKIQKLRTIPTEFEGFKVSLDGAEVTLTKEQGEEKYDFIFENINFFLFKVLKFSYFFE